ncbi:XVIPCD domain-containing protein [Stenotrophomonas sp. YIM B06876]|uniref:XVIPCD domain-containing protein n=1 Tax=Stenotrophomonas sp. YIM B06876 TaxID=3060211 RepID=UPI0027393707|nr:XVIPCD domain-containing protein [Stenotrophomonas sp. YIM B06876]
MSKDRELQLLQEAMRAGITSPRELANFMAQVGHESSGLNRLEEGFRYTRDISQIPVASAMRQGPEALEAARLEALRGRPESLGDLMYGGRMGNNQSGDGYLYRGRGYMQLTGKENYGKAGRALGLDLVKHPELAAQPEHAARIAVWYWESRVLEVSREDVRGATRAINGGLNGLDDRQRRFEAWERELTPDVMERLGRGEVGQPTRAAVAAGADALADGVLRKGERGESVRELQQMLRAQGIRDKHGHELCVDADYGNRTVDAVQEFQRNHGLQADGIAGPAALGKLRALSQSQEQGVALMSDPAHPGNRLFQQAMGRLEALAPQAGFHNRRALENTAGQIALEAQASGLSRIDHVVSSQDGKGLIAVQGEMNDPAMRRVLVERDEAVQQPLELSSPRLAQEAQGRDELLAANRQQEHTRAILM